VIANFSGGQQIVSKRETRSTARSGSGLKNEYQFTKELRSRTDFMFLIQIENANTVAIICLNKYKCQAKFS